MTDKQQALRDLLDKVEAGEKSLFANISLAALDHFTQKEISLIQSAGNGSLDAAFALHNAVLHESVTKQEIWSKRYGGTVELSHRGHVISQGSDVDNNPARAWLIAILKALIAKGEA